ncbi:MAG: hypothetical protein AMXMBFR84_23720 [Candidatus Hydrogenedentota bacterium]
MQRFDFRIFTVLGLVLAGTWQSALAGTPEPHSPPESTPDDPVVTQPSGSGRTDLAAAQETDNDPENASAIGSITKVKGKAYVLREGSELEADVGERLFEADAVRTADDGHVGIVLRDDSMLALGVSSEIKLKDYAFEPIDENYSLVTQLVKGTFSYVSGVIAKLSPDSVKMETPVGIVAVRGTKLFVWIDPSNAEKKGIREETK